MSLRKPTHVNIEPSAPWEGDPFQRSRHGAKLLALIRTLRDQPYVLALNGDWGTGKSVFLRRLEQHFETAEPRVPFVLIDAWANDDAADPLIPFVAALQSRIDRLSDASASSARQSFVTAAAKLAVPTASFLANLGAPGSGGAISAATQFGQTLIDWEVQRAQAAKDFRETLKKVRDLLTGRDPTRPIEMPLVLAIDELDRCRPDFSIRALERIKHFFNVKGVVFLIATDRGNLPAAVQSVYGPSINGELYLRKFFDYEYHLPPPSASHYINVLWNDFGLPEHLVEDTDHQQVERAFHGVDAYMSFLMKHRASLDAYEYRYYFAYFAELLGLQLRDQAQAFTMLAAHIRTTPTHLVRLPLIDCLCVCIRYSDPTVFRELQRGRFDIRTLSVDSANERTRASAGLRKLPGLPEGRALTMYFSHSDRDSLLASMQQDITGMRDRRETHALATMIRLANRVQLNGTSPNDYISNLLWLAHALDVDQ